MVKAREEDIVGIQGKNGLIYCLECIPDELFREVTLDSLITSSEIEKKGVRYFCDVCKKQIVAKGQKTRIT
jgi:hypothetical protein